MKLAIQKLNESVPTPEYATSGSAAFDLTNQAGHTVLIVPGETIKIPTGLIVKVPTEHVGLVSSRSGISLKNFRVGNAPGIIDSDYRGEIIIIASNSGDETITIAPGERIAQFTVVPVVQCDIEIVESIAIEDGNERGIGGFGSTGT